MSDEREPTDAALSRLYAELRHEEPPAQVDAAILAAARKAVGSGPRATARGRPAFNWHALAGVAAVLTLALLLVPSLMQEEQLAMRPQALDDTVGGAMSESDSAAEPAPPVPESVPPAAPAAAAQAGAAKRREERAADFADRARNLEAESYGRAAGALMAPAREMGKLESAEAPRPLDAWLADIRRLLERGERGRALDELAALRRAYPDARIDPASLPGLDTAAEPAGVAAEPPAVE